MREATTVTSQAVGEGKGLRSPFPSGTMTSWFIKLVILGLIDSLGILAVVKAFAAQWWLGATFLVLALVAANVTYFRKGGLAFKYLLPGLVFLIAFQLVPAVATFGASFTNYGTGHLLNQEQARTQIIIQTARPAPDSQSVPITPVESGGEVAMLITDPTTGEAQLGTSEGLEPAPGATFEAGKAVGLEGYTTLNLGSLTSDAELDSQWNALTVPVDLAQGTFLQAQGLTTANLLQSGITWDEATDSLTRSSTGEVFTADPSTGSYTSPAGEQLSPGWPVFVGLENYTQIITDPTIRANFVPILVWSFVFAFGTVLMQFGFGLLMAMVMSDRRMRGQRFYRLILILPYALPIFMTALVWKGMLNADFGIINQILGVRVDWLGDPTLAKMCLLVVNLWIGYSYMFLVVTGALTSIPGDLKEAAFVDGASGFYAFRTVVLPLLLVSVSPLLIASFSFNFNNFTLVQLLTGGGPFTGSPIEGGQTDLLITYTFRLAFGTNIQLLGFASAIAMLIFLIVAGVSAFGFRLTRRLEEIKV